MFLLNTNYKFNNIRIQSMVTFCHCVVILVRLVKKCLLYLAERALPARLVEALVHSMVQLLQLMATQVQTALTSWKLSKQTIQDEWNTEH